ncbi:MAG: nuclear transport factor 2 family protein [Rhodanobacteraceae bacterium]
MSKTWLIAGLLAVPSFAGAAETPETERSVEGVRAVEAHWQRAFLGGDAAYLDTLLDPAYVSVGRAGNARPKAEIIALANTIAQKKMTPQPPEHPATIVVRDNAAIVTNTGSGESSADVFYYADGRWHAWYSQHTPLQPSK